MTTALPHSPVAHTPAAYNPVIDGLRCVAVLPVLLFHAGFAPFGGGFVGVDVFFVISGYLITGILLRDLAEGRHSLLRFYERRARRILPALFAVILATVPFAWAWMTAPHYADFSKSIVAVLFFVSNILFWQQSGYFDVAAEEKPLLHTWSLAIEEQYYLVFPLLLMLLWRRGPARPAFRASFWAVLLLALASLGLSEAIARDRAVANFYLLPTRAWELLAGSLCAFARLQPAPRPLPGRLPGPLPRLAAEALAAAGLAMIGLSVLAFDASTPFPSLYTLLPVGGAALVILFAGPGGPVGVILGHRLAVGIGLLSYSLYLWHQPVFALARLRFDVAPGGAAMAGLCLLALALAWATWRWIERPFRYGLPLGRFAALTGAAATLALGLGLLGIVEARLGWSRLAPVVYTDAVIDTDRAQAETWTAVLDNPALQEELSRFPEGTGGFRLLVVGDSHAKDLFNALYLTSGGPPLEVRRITLGGGCTDRIGARFEAVTAAACFADLRRRAGPLLDQADAVLLTRRWTIDRSFPAYLPVFLAGLADLGKPAAIAGNTVEYAPAAPQLIERLARRGALPEAAAALAAARRAEVGAVNAELRAIAAAAGVPFLDKVPLLCDPGGTACDALTGTGRAIYYDYGHWTLDGARHVGARIRAGDWLAPLTGGRD
jgi:peptidoglycan/LPS O-acetylase OafA/YrhL